MTWLHLVSYFFGGMFLANTFPHWISGLMGHAFPTPFAKPPGKGLSSPTVNVLWGLLNLVIAYLLLLRVGTFDLHVIPDALAFFAGMLAISLQLASHFGAVQKEAQVSRAPERP